MTMISEHFSLEELTYTSKPYDNTPSLEIIQNLKVLAANLEKIRAIFDAPIHINSAYRSPAVNKAVGGSPTSAHLTGFAADIEVTGMTSRGVSRRIAQAMDDGELPGVDQLIYEGSWSHVSFAPEARGEKLTANFSTGKVAYTQGIN